MEQLILTKARFETMLPDAVGSCKPQSTASKAMLGRVVNDLEMHRISNHTTLSARVYINDEGFTGDVACFVVVCIGMVAKRLQEPETSSDRTVEVPIVSRPGAPCPTGKLCLLPKAIDKLTPRELGLAFASIFHNARQLDWLHPETIECVHLLHKQAAHLLVSNMYPNVRAHFGGDATNDAHAMGQAEMVSHRALWSCATARLKMITRHYTLWASRLRSAPERTDVVSEGELQEAADTIATRLQPWLARVIKTWNGPRLREAVAKAIKKRDCRVDEVGRTMAFSGGNTLCRARGALDAAETALHEIDLELVLSFPYNELSMQLVALREIIVLKLFHNAIESETSVAFMQQHVVLHSMRDHGRCFHPRVNMIVELAGGWVLAPPLRGDAISDLDTCLARWYAREFYSHGRDPLKIATRSGHS